MTERPFLSNSTNGNTFTTASIKPYKFGYDKYWTVTADLRALETFENYYSNYDIRNKLLENGVLLKTTDEDSESCQFFAYFKTKQSAESFIKRLTKYVEKRKEILSLL